MVLKCQFGISSYRRGLEKFILEMGLDFAFLARQKHLVLDGKKNYAIFKDVLAKIK